MIYTTEEYKLNKVAIVTDTNSGLTTKTASAYEVYVISMPFMIDQNTFYEDVDLSKEDFYRNLTSGVTIHTSQPSPADVMELWDKILLEYESLVYIPMSSGLSSSCHTAMMLAKEYAEGKIYVIDNQRISVTQRQSVLDAVMLRDQGKSAAEIKEILLATKFDSSIYIMLDTLDYLKKGGRVTPAAAALGTVFKLKPVLQIQGQKLDAFAKARTLTQAKTIMMTAIRSDIEKRFGGLTEEKQVWLEIAHTENEKAAKVLQDELQEFLPGYDIFVDHLPFSIACHIGPGSLAIACCKKLM